MKKLDSLITKWIAVSAHRGETNQIMVSLEYFSRGFLLPKFHDK